VTRSNGSGGKLTCVLDSSALLAMLHSEPGGEVVEELIGNAAMSSVNWSEVVQKILDKAHQSGRAMQDLESLGLRIVPFTTRHAEQTAFLRAATRHKGLSFADRACLALSAELGLPAVTADRIWKELEIEIEVQLAR